MLIVSLLASLILYLLISYLIDMYITEKSTEKSVVIHFPNRYIKNEIDFEIDDQFYLNYMYNIQ
jgi:hypothetical protein